MKRNIKAKLMSLQRKVFLSVIKGYITHDVVRVRAGVISICLIRKQIKGIIEKVRHRE